ncbi:PAAR motif protein [compost metagenome]
MLFDGLPAARLGDASACGGAMSGNVIANVLINGKPAAVLGSVGSHGNVVVGGSGTVLIGTNREAAPLISPSPLSVKGFDIRALLVDQASGAPLQKIAYTAVLEDGSEIHGTTDPNGLTQALGHKNSSQNIRLSAHPGWLLRGE